MLRRLPVLTLFSLVILSGVVHGLWTGRWTVSEGPERAAARLPNVPMTVGEWDGSADELDARQVAGADISGHLLRRYVNRRSGDVMTLLVLCGRPGPVSVHVPDVCYRGAGFEQVGERVHYAGLAAQEAEFWVSTFKKQRGALPAEHLRIFYAWTATGPWTAPENPRFAFAGPRPLYKMYVLRQLPRGDEPLENAAAIDFIRVLMPEMRKALFPPS